MGTTKIKSPLHDAAFSGNQENILVLLRGGVDINERNRYGWTPLMTAVTKDHLDCIRLLLDHGADLHAISDDGMTALHQAALYGKIDAAKLLISLEADVNAHDTFGSHTPLHLAAAHAHRKIVIDLCSILLAAGAEVDARSKWNTTPLFSASVANRSDLVDFLLKNGAELDPRDTQGRTPLIFVSKMGFSGDMAALLLTRGADVNAQDADGRTALMYAALNAHRNFIDILLDGGASIWLQDLRGRTALMYAAGEAPKSSVIGVLGREASTHDAGANTANWDPENKAARLAKAYHARAECVQHLLKRGADPEQQDDEGKTALDLALENARTVGDDNSEVVALLSGYERNH
ncbi:MAG: ankyrin repeat domain-containing protein [Janthinobacterium lividum]